MCVCSATYQTTAARHPQEPERELTRPYISSASLRSSRHTEANTSRAKWGSDSWSPETFEVVLTCLHDARELLNCNFAPNVKLAGQPVSSILNEVDVSQSSKHRWSNQIIGPSDEWVAMHQCGAGA